MRRSSERDDASSFTTCASRRSCRRARKVYCGARDGDYFELKGEMLTLPPGQGFSIYSLAAVLPLLAAKQRPTHRNDWMTSDAEIACPDPNCQSRLRIVRLGLAQLPPQRNDRDAAARRERRMSRVETFEIAPGYAITRIIRGGWQLAGGHGAIDAPQRSTISSPPSMPASQPSTAPTSTPASRSSMARCGRGFSRRAGPRRRGGFRFTPSSCPTSTSLPSLRRADVEAIVDRSLPRLGVEALDLVQFHWWDYDAAALVGGVRLARRSAAGGQAAPYRRHEFRHAAFARNPRRQAARSSRCRCNIPCSTGDRRTASPLSVARTASRCCATARWRAGSCRTAGWARPNRRRRSPIVRSTNTSSSSTTSAAGPLFQEPPARAAPRRRPARRRHRHRRDAR